MHKKNESKFKYVKFMSLLFAGKTNRELKFCRISITKNGNGEIRDDRRLLNSKE